MTKTVAAAVDAAALAFGDAAAIVEPNGPTFTYAELHRQVRKVAGALIASGIEPGDRVAIWSPNTHHWVLGALGTLYAGAILVPVNTRYTGHEALDVISRTRAQALLVAGQFLGSDRLAQLRVAAAGSDPNDGTGARPDANTGTATRSDTNDGTGTPADSGSDHGLPGLLVQLPVEPGQPASTERRAGVLGWAEFLGRAVATSDAVIDFRAAAVTPGHVSDILFTSGTTGRSKGAMSTHRQALDVARAWADCAELSQSDRYLIVNPFFHSFGYKAGILACLQTGAAMIPQLVFDPGVAIRLIEAERVTVFPGAPTIYTSLLDHPDRDQHDLSSLRLAVTGAAVVPVALVERMRAELTFEVVLTAYGLTEAVVVTMCRAADDPETVATTSGRATADFEIRIGESGEILLRGPNVMLGYLDDQTATEAAIDLDGWLHTGDIGELNTAGYLTITDRLKDMYICGGFNVYPAEIEQALARHPAVAESVVIGVPDARLGEVGKAFVVLRPGAQASDAELIEFCQDRLAGFKVPRQLELRTDLPRNPAGKPLKRLLRQEAI